MIFKFSHSTLEGKYPLENILFLNCWKMSAKLAYKKIQPFEIQKVVLKSRTRSGT